MHGSVSRGLDWIETFALVVSVTTGSQLLMKGNYPPLTLFISILTKLSLFFLIPLRGTGVLPSYQSALQVPELMKCQVMSVIIIPRCLVLCN